MAPQVCWFIMLLLQQWFQTSSTIRSLPSDTYIYIQFNQLNYRALFCTTTSTWIPNTKTKTTTNLSDTTACFSGVVIPLHHHEHAVDYAFLMWVTTHLLNLDAKTCPDEASEDDWAAEHLFIHDFLLGIRRCQVQRWAYDSQVVAMRRTEQGWNLILPVLIWFQHVPTHSNLYMIIWWRHS